MIVGRVVPSDFVREDNDDVILICCVTVADICRFLGFIAAGA